MPERPADPIENNQSRGLIPPRFRSQAKRLALVAVCCLAVWSSSRHLSDEAAGEPGGDMPRYLMNGVFLMDLLHDRPFGSVGALLHYAQLYYARYPALSIGHHPPLVSVAAVPALAVFGVSVKSGRLVSITAFAAAVAFLFLLARDLYGGAVATIAAGLLATNSRMVGYSQMLVSEPAAVALVIGTVYAVQRYCRTQSRSSLVAFATAAVLSVYAKQLTIFVWPAYFLIIAFALGLRRLFTRELVMTGVLMTLLIFPIIAVTVEFSPSNVKWAIEAFQTEPFSAGTLVTRAIRAHFSVPVIVFAGVGLLTTIITRDRRAAPFVLWIIAVIVEMVVAGRIGPERLGVYWIPAVLVIAASVIATWRRAAPLLLALGVVLIGVHARTVASQPPIRSGGYEEAAQYVLASDPGATVMLTGDWDSGYFSFFIRKHDPDRRLVVLRSDKLFTTSLLLWPSVEDRIQNPTQMYDILHRLGTKFVVAEDLPSQSQVLEWVRQELHSPRFLERKRIPLRTRDPILRGTDLAIYELRDARPPDPDAQIDMHLPLVSRSVTVSLSDLINRKYLR
jgi:dolichyl-phosphate-mannose-protein mannosyltransferase